MGKKDSYRRLKSCLALAVVLLLFGCSKAASSQPASTQGPVVVAKAVSVTSSSECQVTSDEEMKTSLVRAFNWGVESWIGPEGLVKKIWELSPDIWHLQDPVVITGRRLDGNERAEFLHYDETWMRRTNLVFQPPHTTTGYTWDSTGQRIYIV